MKIEIFSLKTKTLLLPQLNTMLVRLLKVETILYAVKCRHRHIYIFIEVLQSYKADLFKVVDEKEVSEHFIFSPFSIY